MIDPEIKRMIEEEDQKFLKTAQEILAKQEGVPAEPKIRQITIRRAEEPKKYLLAHGRMGYFGNSPYWWAKAGGYTPYIDKAQLFTLSEAKEHRSSTKNTHDFKIYNYEDVIVRAHYIADVQNLTDKVITEE